MGNQGSVQERLSQMGSSTLPVRQLETQPIVDDSTDIAVRDRNQTKSDVRIKFDDIFQVSSSCEGFVYYPLDSHRDDVSVVGRLSSPSVINFFKFLGASDLVLNTLKYGHKPYLVGEVPEFERNNNSSFYKHHSFAINEIFNLIRLGKVELVDKKPHCVHPLQVEVQPNKNRLILDCSFLNKLIQVPKFKFEDSKVGLSYFQKDGYIFSFDMKDGYHHILINDEFRTYLGFKFEYDGKTLYAQFKVCPFGLRDVPYIFTKVLRPLVKHWRSHGMKCCMYLDDGIGFALDFQRCKEESIHVRKDLIRAGIVWSIKKSQWDPVKVIDWIGFRWDTSNGTIAVTPRRVDKIKGTCLEILKLQKTGVRKLAGFIGQVISTMRVTGDIARLSTRRCQILVALTTSWDAKIDLDGLVKDEIKFWLDNIDKFNKHYCFPNHKPVVVDLIKGDASNTGCGSFLNELDNVTARLFSEFERSTSSTWRELSNIQFSLWSFLPQIKNRSVKFLTDSQAAARICQVGSMNPVLQYFAHEIFNLCFQNLIDFKIHWIPRGLNKDADAISRLADEIDIDDWGITVDFFKILDGRWGPITIDLFANYYNSKTQRFYSLFITPHSSGVDAFSYDWSSELGLMVPPIPLVSRAILHAKLCRCSSILVVPYWPSSDFWPLLVSDFRDNIKDLVIVKGSKVIQQGLNKNSIFGSENFKGNFLAMKMDFSN
jgi:hypothetical protein